MTQAETLPGWRKAIAWTLSCCLVWQSTLLYAASSPERQTGRIQQAAASDMARLDNLFQPDKLLEDLGFDADEIVRFVTNDIAFQPYAGVLRGVQGTLAGRAGNAHDQALALASLLRDAGFDAQILLADLSDEQARELTASMAMPRFPTSQGATVYPESLRKLIESNSDALVKPSELIEQTRGTVDALGRLLVGSAANAAPSGIVETGIESSKSYRWVRYREGPADAWAEVHPAYAGAERWGLKFASVEDAQISPGDLQTFGLDLWIENSKGERHSVSGKWSAPAANIGERLISLELGSDAVMRSDLWRTPERLVNESQFFYVQVNDQVLADSLVFDLNGNVYGSDAMMGLSSLFSTINRAGNKGADALRGMGADPAKAVAQYLTRVGLDFHIKTPVGERTVRRVLYEGNAVEEPETAALRLLQRWDLSITTTTPMPQYYDHLKAGQMLDALERFGKFQDWLGSAKDASDELIIETYDKALGNPSETRLTYLRSLFDQFQADNGIVSYAPEVNVLAIRYGFDRKGDTWSRYEMADIVANTRWSFALDSGKPVPDLRASLARGVWETRAEQMRLPLQAQDTISTSAYDRLSQVTDFRVDAGDPGSVRVLPEGPGEPESWWQIDSRTGSTIGMLESYAGIGGSEISEEVLMNRIALSISVVFAAVGAAVCMEGGGRASCCVGSSIGLAIMGYALSAALGALALKVGLGWGVGVSSSVLIDIGFTTISVDCS